jgi:gamma-glutamylcyclotransferase (GGCT)/AIG2-like uncharacterized protein YtfP
MNQPKKHLIFTYGSLMSGLGNHRVMQRAGGVLVSEKESITGMALRAYCSGFPGAYVSDNENHYTVGEVYEVDEAGLLVLDRLESEGYFYHRQNFTTKSGLEVQAYVLKKEDAKGKYIPSGDWRFYKEVLGNVMAYFNS